jgi:putative sterol carrier protein
MDAKTLFNEKMPAALAKDPGRARELDATYLFKVTGERGGTWTVDCKAETPKVVEGEEGAPECTIELADEDFEAMLKDPQMAMQLFFQGKIKITGDPVLATKLGNLFGLGQGG